jgi:phosphatidylglycerophosphate synthase
VRAQPQHLLSLSRVLLGGLVCAALHDSPRSWVVLPAVLAACIADYCDGILARRSRQAGNVGRLIDNVSDASFLALAFSAFARASTSSDPVSGTAVRYWEHANWLPLIGLVLSFGTYLLRWAIALLRGVTQERSMRGHHAGILNYALALVGGLAVVPGVHLTPWLLEPLCVAVALFNVTAAIDSIGAFAIRPAGRA